MKRRNNEFSSNDDEDDCWYCHGKKNFLYEWEDTLYDSGDYTALLDQFQKKIEKFDSENDIPASINERYEQASHLEYLCVCFQRMLDHAKQEEQCTCGGEYYKDHIDILGKKIAAIEHQAKQLEQYLKNEP